MNDKPKRWTWEESLGKYKVGDPITPNLIEDVFKTNEPLIDWQEKEIRRLKVKVSEYAVKDLNCSKERENKILKQRIEELEKKNEHYIRTWNQPYIEGMEKTIATLREALENILKAEKPPGDWGYCDLAENMEEIARTALNKLEED